MMRGLRGMLLVAALMGTAAVPATGNVFFDGRNAIARYLLNVHGSVDLPWGVMASTNLNVNDGAIRDLVINGPGPVYGGDGCRGQPTTITYDTLHFETTGTHASSAWCCGISDCAGRSRLAGVAIRCS